ncbi:DNA ligase D [Peribacillus tepidiphilus]|uniref:DNA ligase D n=1 Tax=Peribacillus tepidiphilus TaxID=2652445 RepID=UPI0035B56111
MLPTSMKELPIGPEWKYEPKYDGFRALMYINGSSIMLISRNGTDLSSQFPEILRNVTDSKPPQYHSLLLDGEIVWLTNPYKSDFQQVQLRGRLRSQEKISLASTVSPCTYVCFDILELDGENLTSLPYSKRREILENLFNHFFTEKSEFVLIHSFDHPEKIWQTILLHDSEGAVAKKTNSTWEKGTRTTNWLKIKNKKTAHVFITSYNRGNGYFEVGVWKEETVVIIGRCKNGFQPEEYETLRQAVMSNASEQEGEIFFIEPSIVVTISYLHVMENELREPEFQAFLFDVSPTECTWEAFTVSSFVASKDVSITSKEKPIWDGINKAHYLTVLRDISTWLLFYLQNRPLTVIRYPHGIFDERFFQKNCPNYAPKFIQTYKEDDTDYILCNDLKTLLWLGNQLAIEFHIPFQEAGETKPSEIVLDLDPEDENQFQSAIKAALLLKDALDNLSLQSFIKTSGNRGLQIHIPLPKNTFSYLDTRIFTNFLSDWLIQHAPEAFTVERLKKNRGNRLYLDFVQHAEGKTIIAPYSPRANEFAGIAAPLYWEEVNESLNLKDYNIHTIYDRIKKYGCPFAQMEAIRNVQPFEKIMAVLKMKYK